MVDMPKPLRGPGFHVVFEDARVLVVHKGPGVLSVADRSGKAALPEHLQQALRARDQTGAAVHPVHRLDRSVSGLLLFARDREARDHLKAQFEGHELGREYVAIVQGMPKGQSGAIRKPLASRSGGRADLPAVTHWKVLRRGRLCTLVEVRLETGRKHQIRQHFAAIGHPLLGDREYNGPERDGFDRRRIALHALRLHFKHPDNDRLISIEDPMPATFERPLTAQAGRR
jgi:RluA family pseudouridine synthase